jgi:hypothetical protein
VFLPSVGSVGHVVHSGASRARNIDTLFFMLKWAQCGFHKKRARTCYNKLVFLLLVGSAGSDNAFPCVWSTKPRCAIFYAQVGRLRFQTRVFAFGGICGSHSAFRCIKATKRRHTFSSSGGPGVLSLKSAQGHVMMNLCFCICWDLRVI